MEVKFVKRFCVAILLLFFLCAVFPQKAVAQDVQWVRITEDDVNLYATCENSKVMFELPKSYYLQVLGEKNGMYNVAIMQNEEDFPQITGYVWKIEVEDCDEPPQPPYYPTEKITVNTDSAQLKLSPVPSAETLITVTNTQTMSFYGETKSYGETWYYVYFAGKFGYVTSDCVTKPIIAMHPTPLPQDVVVPPTDEIPDIPLEEEPDGETGITTEIFLIVFVAILAVSVCLALFLPGNLKKKDVFDKDL